jgi:alpha-glucosidase
MSIYQLLQLPFAAALFGSMNAVQRRQLDIPLAFLEPAIQYTAWIHSDARPEGDAPKQVRNETKIVTPASVLSADMAANGGQAVRLVPVE